MSKAAVAAKSVGMKTTDPTYDVAISFLVADEKTASQIKSGLAGLNVFFYPHNQEELVGTNGIESMREPFLAARVNVILFRERYGVVKALFDTNPDRLPECGSRSSH
jgi:hypothetical protein